MNINDKIEDKDILIELINNLEDELNTKIEIYTRRSRMGK